MERRERKVRLDKKRAIAAPLDDRTYEQVAKISYICDVPLKTIGEVLCTEGYRSSKMLDRLKVHFRRNLLYEDNRYLFGDPDRKAFRFPKRPTKRLYMRFQEFEYDRFKALSYSLDCSVQVAAALLIHQTTREAEIIFPVLSRFIYKTLDEKRASQLRDLSRYLNEKSPEYYITTNLVLGHALEISLKEGKKITKVIDEIRF